MAAAASESNTTTPGSTVRCTGGYQFGNRLFHDWKAGGHGMVDMNHALVHSCERAFLYGRPADGIDTIAEYAKQFGLGQETGVELPSERVGIVPSTA